MLPWDDLKFVLALARCGNATAAARALNVNATTVTRRVQALEEHLGVRLFDRQPTGMSPTEAGQAAVQAAERVEEEVLGLDAEVRGLDRELRGTLTVSAVDSLFEVWMADFAALGRRMPRVEVTLSAATHNVDLNRREADVALRFTDAPPEYLVGRRLVELLFAVYGSRDLVERVRAETGGAASYADYPWVGWEKPWDVPTDRVIDECARGAAVPVRVNTMPMVGHAIAAGFGISVMPCFYGDRHPELVRVGPYFEGGVYMWALTHEQLRRTARVRAFMDFVTELIKRDKDLMLGQRPRCPAVPVVPSGPSGPTGP